MESVEIVRLQFSVHWSTCSLNPEKLSTITLSSNMHEQAFIDKIIEQASAQGEIESVFLEIGELAHVSGEELVTSFRTRVSWEIDWKEIPAQVMCDCGFSGHPTILERGHDYFMIECPECRGVPVIVAGTDIKLVSVRVK
jgi:Zn finger protein HypA/HybF involved in hydrogenase expression